MSSMAQTSASAGRQPWRPNENIPQSLRKLLTVEGADREDLQGTELAFLEIEMKESFVESLNAEPSSGASYCRLVESGTVLASSDTAAHAPHRHSQAPYSPYRLRIYCFYFFLYSIPPPSLPPALPPSLYLPLFFPPLPSHAHCILPSWVVCAQSADPFLSCLPFIATTLVFSRVPLFLYYCILLISLFARNCFLPLSSFL
ncbi:hypothetical protein BDW75DRAFT_109075 [Aspergillus navahoensis]